MQYQLLALAANNWYMLSFRVAYINHEKSFDQWRHTAAFSTVPVIPAIGWAGSTTIIFNASPGRAFKALLPVTVALQAVRYWASCECRPYGHDQFPSTPHAVLPLVMNESNRKTCKRAEPPAITSVENKDHGVAYLILILLHHASTVQRGNNMPGSKPKTAAAQIRKSV